MRPENTRRAPANVPRWFDLRGLDLGSFAFMMNRLSGLGLTLYLFLHLLALGQLAIGGNAYDGFIALVRNPVFIAGEFLVVAAVLLHGLNGLRIAITSLGVAVPRHKELFIVLMIIALAGCTTFAIKMFGGD